jgi:hypothetical protein
VKKKNAIFLVQKNNRIEKFSLSYKVSPFLPLFDFVMSQNIVESLSRNPSDAS